MSAPGVLGVRPDSVPGEVPYLAADPARIAAWRRGSAATASRSASTGASAPSRSWFGRQRDIPLAAFAPLAEMPGVRLISLQKGAPAGQIAQVRVPRPDRACRTPTPIRRRRASSTPPRVMTQPRPDRHLRHLGRASGGRAGAAGVHRAAAVADWRWLRERDDTPVVSDHAAVPAEPGRRTGATCSRASPRRSAR